jgi:hypothetical protein
MFAPKMQRAAPSATVLCVARLPGYSLHFNKRSEKDGSGKGNIQPDASETVWGVVFDIAEEDRPRLDRSEGGYHVVAVEVSRDGSETLPAITYVANVGCVDDTLEPYTWYKTFVVRGARQHLLPDEYITRIEAVGASVDPKPTRERVERSLLDAITAPADALAFVREHKVVTLTTTRWVPSLVEAIAGAPIKGSWWSHPRGKLIFACASAIEDALDVLALKLVEGKVTFVHRALWPALVRVVTDDARRAQVGRGIGRVAMALLQRVDREGELHFDQVSGERAALTKARALLEQRLLVLSSNEHTERGAHASVLRSWSAWTPKDVAGAAAAMGYEDALTALRAACGGAEVGAQAWKRR